MSELMNAMHGRPMTSSEIMERMGLSSKQNFLKNYIRPAVAAGFIAMTSPDSPNSRSQRHVKVQERSHRPGLQNY